MKVKSMETIYKSENIELIIDLVTDRNNKIKPVLIIPGGAYSFVSLPNEGYSVASYFKKLGYSTFILNYKVAPNRFPTQVKNVYEALTFIKEHSGEFNLDLNELVLVGSSAGGHLALNSTTLLKNEKFMKEIHYENLDTKIKGLVLLYPVTMYAPLLNDGNTFRNLLGDDFENGEKIALTNAAYNVYEGFPKTFIYSTFEDDCVDIKHTLTLAANLREKSADVELHVFNKGRHGMGLCEKEYNEDVKEDRLQANSLYVEALTYWIKNL